MMRLSVLLIIQFVFQALVYYGKSGPTGNKTRVTQKWADYRPKWLEDQFQALKPESLRHGSDHELAYELNKLNQKSPESQSALQANRFTTYKTTVRKRKRTTQYHDVANETCDYLALNCLKAYQTGRLCGKTIYYRYFTFKNYCMLDFVNCRERYDMWQVLHMGDCVLIKPTSEVFEETYWASDMMAGYYVIDKDLL